MARREWRVPIALCVAALIVYRWTGMWPLQRYPNWDWAWIDARSANSLSALRRNLGSGQMPSLDLRTNLGFDYVGDVYPIANPLNLLIGVIGPVAVLWLRMWVLVCIGCCGTYFWLRRWSGVASAVAGALLFLSLPYLTGLHLFTTIAAGPFVLPLLLITVERVNESMTWKSMAGLWVACAVGGWFGDVNVVLVVMPIVIVYGAAYGRLVLGGSWRRLGMVCVLGGAAAISSMLPLLLPLLANSRSIKDDVVAADLLPHAASTADVWGFLRHFGLESLVWPFEGAGLLLYCPLIFLMLGVIGMVVPSGTVADPLRRRAVALLALVSALVLQTFVVNSESLLRIVGVGDSGTRGILRVHLNLIPYLLLFFGLLGVGRLAPVLSSATRFVRWTTVLAFSVMAAAIDALLLGVFPRWSGIPLDIAATPHLPASSQLGVPFAPVLCLVLLHLGAAAMAVLACADDRRRMPSRFAIRGVVLSAAGLAVVLGTISAQLELFVRSSQQWHWTTATPHRVDAFAARRACVESMANVNDPNVRVLYSGLETLETKYGRSWANLMELELGQSSGQHTLFSYRELELPTVGVYYSEFGVAQSALFFPPRTAVVASRVSLLRLLGVRYVVSADATLADAALNSGDFRALGACPTPIGPTTIQGEEVGPDVTAAISGAGTTYVYEVLDSPGIFSLGCSNEVMARVEALTSIGSSRTPYWEAGVVSTEQPLGGSAEMKCGGSRSADDLTVESENGSDVHLRVETTRPSPLVAAYAYRPGWSATVDGEDVPVFRAYGGLLAISLPKGSHSVVFSYRSSSLTLGLVLFAASGFGLFAGVWWRRSRGPKASPPESNEEPAGATSAGDVEVGV